MRGVSSVCFGVVDMNDHLDGVMHLDLNAAPPDERPVDVAMVIYWLNGLPVGHRHLNPDEGLEGIRRDLANHAAAPSLSPLAPSSSRTATVVICTRDRPEALANCLRTLARQTRIPDQIVVVDNASKDGRTRAAAEAAGVDYVLEPRPGLDIARNAGARAATGDIIVYTDDDVLLHDTWLDRMVAAVAAPGIMAVTGLVLPAEMATPAQILFEREWGFGRGYAPKDFGPEFFARHAAYGCPAWQIGAGASMAFRRECFRDVGWFDERLDVGAAGCSGDSEYWHRILSNGHTIRYEPTAIAFHVHRRDMEGLRKQIFAYMRGHAAALMVQYERTRHRGELRRALLLTPAYYARRAASRLLRGERPRDAMLWVEIRGFVSGLWFYLITPRRLAGDRK